MLVYLITIGIIICIFLIQSVLIKENDKNIEKPKNNKLIVMLLFCLLGFVAAFRYGVGTDFYGYYITDNWVNKFENKSYNNPGFTLFSIVCSWIFGGINGAITIGAAFVTIALFVFAIAKNTNNLFISIMLFIFTGIFTGMFNGVRQFLAAAILFAGHRFIIDKKLIKWLIVVLISASIHITAILMFFVYFVCNLKCNWKLVFVYLAIGIILLFSYEPLFNLVGALKQEEINANDDVYMSNSVNILRVAVHCVPILMLFFLDKEKLNNDKETRFLFNICLLNAAIAVAAINSTYLSRFCIYTTSFQMLMYPRILGKMEKNNKFWFTLLLLFFYAIFWVYGVMNSTSIATFKWIFNYL